MFSILAATAPIYAVILIGYLAGRLGIVAADDFRALGRFVITIAAPSLLFSALSQRAIGDILQGPFVLAYTIGSLAVFGAGFAFTRRLRHRDLQVSALSALGMSSSNSVLIGYPIAEQVLGPVAAVVLAMCVIIENVLMQPLMLAIAESAGTAGGDARRVVLQSLRRLAVNPFIGAIVAAMIVSGTGLVVPEVVLRTVGIIGAPTTALALFVIGGSLVGLELRARLDEVLPVAVAKLVAHPLAVLAGLVVAGVDPALRLGGTLIAAVPMLSIFPIWGQRYGQEQFCAAALLAATVLSFATVTALLWIMA